MDATGILCFCFLFAGWYILIMLRKHEMEIRKIEVDIFDRIDKIEEKIGKEQETQATQPIQKVLARIEQRLYEALIRLDEIEQALYKNDIEQ